MMKSTILVTVVWLTVSVSGFGGPGAYERLWFWYAYQLDGVGRTIAPKCATPPQRCTFREFLHYINLNDNIVDGPLEGVDTDNVDDTIAKVKAAQATGSYDCRHVYESQALGKNDVGLLMQKVNNFVSGRMGFASDGMKTRLSAVTRGCAIGRMVAYQNAIEQKLKEDGWTPHWKQVPLFAGSTDMVDQIDEKLTGTSIPGKTVRDFTAWMRAELEGDPGHAANKDNARLAAGAMSNACRAE